MLTLALDIHREVLGERHPSTVNAAVGVLASLMRLGRKGEAFVLARGLVDTVSMTSPHYRGIITAYNACRPPGYRGLSAEPPNTHASKQGKKKR